jgi:hypothetical protein
VRGRHATARTLGRPALTAQVRAATFRFDPTVAAYDRDAVRAAIAAARPEARRLIDAVDGLVDVRVAATPSGTVGTTEPVGQRFLVTLDLGTAARRYGQRGIARLVLHELGHVVQGALVPATLAARLDAGIPRGWGCEDGQTGSCANPHERFAETFAKWATNDIGVDLDLGYKVPPPPSLDAWGAPLARLAA